MDLLAALASGAVGSVALARSDISDTLPGVAIAISLVPPLSVVGLTLEAGKPGQAGGALLLFTTNVVAILASGVVVMGLSRGHLHAERGRSRRDSRKGAIAAVAVLVVLIAVPLTFTSREISKTNLEISEFHAVIDPWASHASWTVLSVTPFHRGLLARASGPPPEPSTSTLHDQLQREGLGDVAVRLDLVPAGSVEINGG
jgi:uncharacterized membrane protein